MSTKRPLTLIPRLLLLRKTQLHPTRTLTTTSPGLQTDRNPSSQRDAQDSRHHINPEANEYAKSGTDAEAAKQHEAAFDPSIADPQEAKRKAGEGNTVNPLDASPANPDLSHTEGTREVSSGTKKKTGEK